MLRVAIVGGGLRAGGAVEALLGRLAPGQRLSVTIFAADPHPGAGPNFDPHQSPLCLLNMPLRAINLPPARTGFPDFRDWLPPETRDPDHFPPRSDFGAWTATRFAALRAGLPARVSVRLVTGRVMRLTRLARGWKVRGRHFDAVLLVPGQPRTKPDDQVLAWQRHARKSGAQLCRAYPANELIAAASDWRQSIVAIRGLGLSTIDVIRLLTLGRGGQFHDGHYRASGDEPRRILPFSRDGRPPWPKPETAELDSCFDLTRSETEAFCDALTLAMEAAKTRCLPVLCKSLVAPAQRILSQFGAASAAAGIKAWLAAECSAPGAAEARDGLSILAGGIAMAEGSQPPDAGYVIGQIWRKLQHEFREGFNLRQPGGKLAARILAFDEGLKRYSYGPPVFALRELQALIGAGIVSLRVADDPDLCTVPGGWRLVESGSHVDAGVLIDAVLPASRLDDLSEPLFVALQKAGRIHSLPVTGGVKTDPSGAVLDARGRPVSGLFLLGRLATGSVAAPDSLHDCFGNVAGRWAANVLRQAGARTAKARRQPQPPKM